MAKKPICSIHDCSNPRYSRGWCKSHYHQWYRRGDPVAPTLHESGKSRKYFEKHVLEYEGDDCLIWPYANSNGYGVLWCDGKNRYIHRLLCEKKNGPPPSKSHQVAHNCGRGRDGCVNRMHLRWATPKENTADKLVHGTALRGSLHPRAKITESKVREIRKLAEVLPQNDIAKMFGLGKTTVGKIVNRLTWAHVQ